MNPGEFQNYTQRIIDNCSKVIVGKADILQRIHPETDFQSARDLRQVYLAARYDDRERVSRDAVSTAKQALKGTRRAKR